VAGTAVAVDEWSRFAALRLRWRSAAVACKGGDCHCDRRLMKGLEGSTKQLAVLLDAVNLE
jgi:hypothetical protein